MTQEEILGIFFAECDEALVEAERGLEICRAGAHDADTLNAVFRCVHSIKGGAGAFGFGGLQAFTHAFETLLSDLRDGLVSVTGSRSALMLRALDRLSDHIAAAKSGGTAPDDADLIRELDAARTPGSPDESTAAAIDVDLDAMLAEIASDFGKAPNTQPWRVDVRPLRAALTNGGEPLRLLRELARLGGVCIDVDAAELPEIDQIDPAEAYLRFTFELPGDVAASEIEEVFDFVGDGCRVEMRRASAEQIACVDHEARVVPQDAQCTSVAEAAASAPAQAVEGPTPGIAPEEAPVQVASNQSIRIELHKLDRLVDSVGELVIAHAMLAQRLVGDTGASEELATLEGLTRDIQEYAMAIRAQPIGLVFSRVPRILRELEVATGKRVRLDVSGEANELDKTVVERLSEPLTHLIRNAVDHGIEPAADRIAAGKPAEGVLQLTAEHRSGRFIIRVRDDGRGINRARVRQKAIDRGLIGADATLSDEEIDHLIFAPGFSTAESVSNISGRGVGMDVVRQNVKDLGGRISIESTPGQGTVFTLALPLTLAISDGMTVRVGEQTLVIPLAHVIESLRPAPSEVERLGDGRLMLNVRGTFLPILPLAQTVHAPHALSDPSQAVVIVVDTEAAGQAALLVDTICEQRQFVIKSLDTHFRPVPGVAGATILGDGRVALILDVDALVAEAITPVSRKLAA